MSRAAPGEQLLFFSGPARAYIQSPQDLWEKNGAPLQGKASPRSSHGLMGTYVGRESEGEERENEMERPKVVYMLRSACRSDERKHFMRNSNIRAGHSKYPEYLQSLTLILPSFQRKHLWHPATTLLRIDYSVCGKYCCCCSTIR